MQCTLSLLCELSESLLLCVLHYCLSYWGNCWHPPSLVVQGASSVIAATARLSLFALHITHELDCLHVQ
jgi:hypothetical protein